MKDDDSSSIVRSQTAHRVDVSEYSGNATTPQNHVTSDVDRVLEIHDTDAGPTRQLVTTEDTHVGDTVALAPEDTVSDEPPRTDATQTVDTTAQRPASHPIGVAADPFHDELAAIEAARTTENRQHLPSEALVQDPDGVVPASTPTASTPLSLDDSPSETATHTESGSTDSTVAVAAHIGIEAHTVSEPLDAPSVENRQIASTPVDAPHVEAVPSEPLPSDRTVSEAKPVFADSRATPPSDVHTLNDAELALPELGHPLADPEPEPDSEPHPSHAHTAPAHHPFATSAALAELNKDEFQGRLAGIKREVQALNDRLTDFEAELDKEGVRPTRR